MNNDFPFVNAYINPPQIPLDEMALLKYEVIRLKAEETKYNTEALRKLIREEVRAALTVPPNHEEIRAALEKYYDLLAECPIELECDADWRTKRDALQFVAGLLLGKEQGK
jgi:hypothetical protein